LKSGPAPGSSACSGKRRNDGRIALACRHYHGFGNRHLAISKRGGQAVGDTADIEVAARSDELLAKGDIDGQRVWLRILKATDDVRLSRRGELKH
jgi:hypothetical protein